MKFSAVKAYLRSVPGATMTAARRFGREMKREKKTDPGVVSELLHRRGADSKRLLDYVSRG